MGDRGQEAIHAAGRVIEPARGTSIFQPSVSSWSKAPARRVLSVAAVMDVAWTILQPAPCGEQPAEIDDFDAARAQEYSLLAMLLARSPDAATLSRIAKLRGDATPLGLAHLALAQAAGNASAEKIAARVFQPFHWSWARRVASLRIILSHRLSQRAAAGAIARGSPRARHRTRRRTGGSRRITPPFFARSWPGWPAANSSDRRRTAAAVLSRNISPPGSVVSSLIWNEPRRPIFIVMWERSAGSSWRPRQKRSALPA